MDPKLAIVLAIVAVVVYLIAPLPKPPFLEGVIGQASPIVKTVTVTSVTTVTATPAPPQAVFNYTITQCTPQGCTVSLILSQNALAMWPGGQQELAPGSAQLTVPYGSTVYLQAGGYTYNFTVRPHIAVNLTAFSSYCTSGCQLSGVAQVQASVPSVVQLIGPNIQQQVQVQGSTAIPLQIQAPNPPPSEICITATPPGSQICAPVLYAPPRLLLKPIAYIAYSPTQYMVLVEAYNPGSSEYRATLLTPAILGYGYYTAAGVSVQTVQSTELQLGPGERKYIYLINSAPSPVPITLPNGTTYVLQTPPFKPTMEYSLAVNRTATSPPQGLLLPAMPQVEEWAIVKTSLRLKTSWMIYLPGFLRLWVTPRSGSPWYVPPLECSPALAYPVDDAATAVCWFWIPYRLSASASDLGYPNGTLTAQLTIALK
ncbi:MAG: hypothetical protein JZD41_01510 [Thermoproteus sp.]|nr:hypothetical protein [Thermoproteus sp.]